MNVERLRKKVENAIKKAPVTIDIYGDVKTDDGYGGYTITKNSIIVSGVQAVLNNANHKGFTLTVTDGGNKLTNEASTPVLIMAYTEDYIPQIGQYFFLEGIKYTIKNPVNILGLNIYWEIDLEPFVVES